MSQLTFSTRSKPTRRQRIEKKRPQERKPAQQRDSALESIEHLRCPRFVAAQRQSSQRGCLDLSVTFVCCLRWRVHPFLNSSFYTRLCPPSIISIGLGVSAHVKLARDRGTRNCRVIRSRKCVLAAGRFSLPDDNEVGAPTGFSG